MSKYIKIDTALLKTVTAGRMSAKALWRRIMQQPSIDIVRCKECKWYGTDDCYMCNECQRKPFPTDADDFCSYGQRKEGE